MTTFLHKKTTTYRTIVYLYSTTVKEAQYLCVLGGLGVRFNNDYLVQISSVSRDRRTFTINLLQNKEPDIIILFRNWINNLLGFKDEAINDNISDIQEVRTMFSTALKRYGEKIKQEGRQEGLIEGKLEGKKDVAAKMLSLNFSVTDICAVTGLSEEEVREFGEESS